MQYRGHGQDTYQPDPEPVDKGLGIGLSVVQRIVVLCRGRIEIESEVEKGSTFTVFLPD